MLKLNMGCGQNKLAGYVNVDKFEAAEPDVLLDLEQRDWMWIRPSASVVGDLVGWEESSASEVLFNHSLEHMGADPAVFMRIMQNLYRVCAPDAVVQINVPHPRHDHFIGDPTHVRIVTPEVLSLFSKKNCVRWAEVRAANSPLALYADVDFELVYTKTILDGRWAEMFDKGLINAIKLNEALRQHNNVAKEYRMTLKAVKPAPAVENPAVANSPALAVAS